MSSPTLPTLDGHLRSTQSDAQPTGDGVVSVCPTPSSLPSPLVDGLLCPLSRSRFTDPVSTPCCGHTFNRGALCNHVRDHGVCPRCSVDLQAHYPSFDPLVAPQNLALLNLVRNLFVPSTPTHSSSLAPRIGSDSHAPPIESDVVRDDVNKGVAIQDKENGDDGGDDGVDDDHLQARRKRHRTQRAIVPLSPPPRRAPTTPPPAAYRGGIVESSTIGVAEDSMDATDTSAISSLLNLSDNNIEVSSPSPTAPRSRKRKSRPSSPRSGGGGNGPSSPHPSPLPSPSPSRPSSAASAISRLGSSTTQTIVLGNSGQAFKTLCGTSTLHLTVSKGSPARASSSRAPSHTLSPCTSATPGSPHILSTTVGGKARIGMSSPSPTRGGSRSSSSPSPSSSSSSPLPSPTTSSSSSSLVVLGDASRLPRRLPIMVVGTPNARGKASSSAAAMQRSPSQLPYRSRAHHKDDGKRKYPFTPIHHREVQPSGDTRSGAQEPMRVPPKNHIIPPTDLSTQLGVRFGEQTYGGYKLSFENFPTMVYDTSTLSLESLFSFIGGRARPSAPAKGKPHRPEEGGGDAPSADDGCAASSTTTAAAAAAAGGDEEQRMNNATTGTSPSSLLHSADDHPSSECESATSSERSLPSMVRQSQARSRVLAAAAEDAAFSAVGDTASPLNKEPVARTARMARGKESIAPFRVMISPVTRDSSTKDWSLCRGGTLTLSMKDQVTFLRIVQPHQTSVTCALWIKVYSMWTDIKVPVMQALSPILIVQHDSLQDSPPTITPDVCFFPQKVVLRHLKHYNSKASLSKRHKKGLLQKGCNSWCNNPFVCGEKRHCSCQAYPSRIIKKGVRQLKLLLAKHHPDQSDVISIAGSLYAALSLAADAQIASMGEYGRFLEERLRRWGLFMELKSFCESERANERVKERCESLWKLVAR